MTPRRILVSCLAALTLSACGDASLDNLIEQIETPGNVSTISKSCTFPARTILNPAVQSAYLFEYEDFNILRFANVGLSCGEVFIQPEDVGEGCPIPRSIWQADVGLPKTVPYLNNSIPVVDFPARFRGLAVGHNYCGGNLMPMFGTDSRLMIKALSPECLVAEFTNVPDVPIIGHEQPYEYVNLNGSFPVQRCTAKNPEFGMSFQFELAKAQAAKPLPNPTMP